MKSGILYIDMFVLFLLYIVIQPNDKGRFFEMDRYFDAIKHEYDNQYIESDIDIYYPGIRELGDMVREKQTNKQIEKNVLYILCGEQLAIAHNFVFQYNENSIDRKGIEMYILGNSFLEKVNSEYSIQQIENQLEITNCTYENKYEGNLIRIYYPQIENFEDDRKERRINALIKEETLKFLNGLENYDKGTYFFWDYEVKWLNRNMLNVYYEGSYGEAEAMEMCPFAGTIAIDFEEEKAITLSNIITDKNMLGSMLFNGRFENITVWDEIPEMNITGSDVFRQETVFDWRENNAGWYVEGNNLVIVCNTPYFNKYLMNIQEIEDILDSSFLDKLNAGHENVEQDELLTAIKYEYHNRQQSNRIDIYYPQIRGFADADREERINELIREDSLKLLNGVSYENGELYCQLDYEIKYMDEDIISIFYKGFDGSAKGRKLYSAAIATTVSLKEEEIINLNDIVTDFDVLADMLLEDKFENITIWEGMPGTIKMSWLYGKRRESLLENLQREEYDKAKDNIGWYTDGSIFVIVHDSIPDYDEYAINMQEIKSILCGTITSLYGKSGQDGSSPYVSGTFDK